MSVFVVLGVIWAAVLIPPLLRSRADRRAEFIDSFQAQMGALGSKALAGEAIQAARAPRARPRPPANPVKRRRDILGGLLGAMIGSLLLGLIPSLRAVLALHLVLLNLFLGYLALLAHQRSVMMRRHAHLISAQRSAPERLVTSAHAPPRLAPALHTPLGSRR